MTALYGYILAGVVLVAGVLGYWRGYTHATNAATMKMNKHLAADTAAENKARDAADEAEKELLRAQTAISEAYEKGKKDAETTAAVIVSDLRNGTISLRRRWASCEAKHLPGTPPTTAEPDAAAGDREESAGRIVRAAAQCDAQVIHLQQLLLEERKP